MTNWRTQPIASQFYATSFLRIIRLRIGFLSIGLVGFMVTYNATSGSADFAVSGHVTSSPANGLIVALSSRQACGQSRRTTDIPLHW